MPQIYVKTRDGKIIPVVDGCKFPDVGILVRTEKEVSQGSWMYKFIGDGPNDYYTMLCDEQGNEVFV